MKVLVFTLLSALIIIMWGIDLFEAYYYKTRLNSNNIHSPFSCLTNTILHIFIGSEQDKILGNSKHSTTTNIGLISNPSAKAAKVFCTI